MALGGQPVPTGNLIANIAKYIVNYIKSARTSSDPSDGLILKLHYRWTFSLLLGIYVSVLGSWYNTDLMDCVNKYNGAIQVPADYLSFCHTYIFVRQEDNPEERRYLFFYKWLHYVCLFLAFWYYMPRKLNKAFHKPLLRKLCEVLGKERPKYDLNSEKVALGRTCRYINEHMRTHNSLYFSSLASNVFALCVNIVGIGLINYVLQGRFLSYGWMTIPFNRDMEHFTDYMSRTFPPFAECSISKQHELTPGREESFGCRLVLMELYEKLFFILWIWLICLAALSILYILFLVLLHHPYVSRWALRVQKPELAEDCSDDLLDTVMHTCKIGDVWLLYKLKKNVSLHVYYTLLRQLSRPVLDKIVKGNSGAKNLKERHLRNLPMNFFAQPSSDGDERSPPKFENCNTLHQMLLRA